MALHEEAHKTAFKMPTLSVSDTHWHVLRLVPSRLPLKVNKGIRGVFFLIRTVRPASSSTYIRSFIKWRPWTRQGSLRRYESVTLSVQMECPYGLGVGT